MGRVDLTQSSAYALRERFAISAFPTLLFFVPPSGEGEGGDVQIYKFQGKRVLENLEAFARGGWRELDIYDPLAQPPPSPPPTFSQTIAKIVRKHYLLFGILAFALVFGLVIAPLCFSRSDKRSSASHAAQAGPSLDRSFGNVPLSQQEPQHGRRAPPVHSADRTYGNVPLSQQKPHVD